MRMKKYNASRILLVTEIIIILILLAGCFHKEQLVDSFWGEDILEFTTQTEGHGEFCGDRMALSPGVYQIRVRTALSDGQSMYVQMKYESAYFKSLRNNGMTIFSNQDYADFEVYVLDKVPAAYVQCDFFGAGAETLVQLEVWKTNMGNRMLLFIVLVFFAVLDFLVVFRRRILEGKITGKQQVVFWTLTTTVLIACFPILTDYFVGGYDSNFHWARIAYLADALQEGASFPVRMEGTWLYGHGYANSLFYGELFLYIAAFLRIIGFSIMDAYKMFLFLVTATTAVISYHSLKKCVKDENASLFGSIFYVLASYRLFNVYSRAAVGEYLAMAFSPLVCCGMYLLYAEDVSAKNYKKYKWYVIGGMSAILQSHLLSTEMIAFFMVLLCVIFWKKTFRRQTFFQLLEATGITLAINVWFWLPLLYMMNCDVYHMEEALTEFSVQSRGMTLEAFFRWLPNSSDVINLCLGVNSAILFLIYVLWRYRTKKKSKVCMAFVLFSILGLGMCTVYFPADMLMRIPGLGYMIASIQFPWRWMSLTSLYLSFLAAFLFVQVTKDRDALVKIGLYITAATTIMAGIYYVNSVAFEFTPVWLYNEENMGTVGIIGSEYLLSGTQISDFYYHKPVAEDGLVWSEYEKNGTNVTITLDNRTEEVCYLEIPLTGYKGYGIKTLEAQEEIPFITEERGAHGDLRIAVPGGYHGTISISYVGFALFRIAEAVSLLSIIIILGMHLYPYIPLLRSRFIKKEEGTG